MKIGIIGGEGKMGGEILKLIEQSKDIVLSGVVVKTSSKNLGRPVLYSPEIIYSDNVDELCKCSEVIIEFTEPKTTLEVMAKASKHGIPLVSGTTGINQNDFTKAVKTASNIPILWSANMSLGVNLVAKILKFMAVNLDQNFDIEIQDMHHKNKLDAPSGTALMLGRVIADAKKLDFEKYAVLDRQTNQAKRKTNQIGFSSIRAGEIYGEHHISFIGKDESIEIVHRAHNRTLFASGAIRAAKWIYNKAPGLYSMQDLIEFE